MQHCGLTRYQACNLSNSTVVTQPYTCCCLDLHTHVHIYIKHVGIFIWTFRTHVYTHTYILQANTTSIPFALFVVTFWSHECPILLVIHFPYTTLEWDWALHHHQTVCQLVATTPDQNYISVLLIYKPLHCPLLGYTTQVTIGQLVPLKYNCNVW